MLWLVVGILSLASSSGCRNTDIQESSASGAARKGAAVASSIFSTELTFSGVLSELKKAAEAMRKGKEGQGNEFILATLRLLGIHSENEIKDLACDGIIALVHLLGQTLLKDGGSNRTGRTGPRDFSFFHFILTHPQAGNLLKQVRDPKLADVLLKESGDKLQSSEADTDCIRLLLCKAGPFIRGMQSSLEFFMNLEGIQTSGDEGARTGDRGEEICCGVEEASWEKTSLEDRMYFFLPGLGEVTARGDDCDQLFPNCEY